ncbi:cytochrome c [Caulobacter sp. S45]|uniref:c-type cytochrome n=1 Tax=Caulobacter sp. S45 TaxID=1641861 RepID=UPI0015750386|nr:cytochrome c [Caulobacter sp. S45]
MRTFLDLAVAAGLLLLTGAAPTPVPVPALAPAPSSAYADDCSACHQRNGQGVKGAFPALAGDKLVRGDPAALVTLILGGRNGMPSFRNDLSDAELAAAASYIRSSWGNVAAPVTVDFVSKVRKRTDDGTSARTGQNN